MKHLKILALAAMACAALMAFASTASATTLSTGSGTVKKGTIIHAESIGQVILSDTSGFFQNQCESTVQGETTNETGTSVTGKITALNWFECSGETNTIVKGNLSVAWNSGSNGTLSGSGSEVTTVVGGGAGVCVYGTGSGTVLGTVDGAATNTSHAIMTVNAVLKRIKTESGICPETARWKGEYTVTSPVGLKVTN